MKNLREKVQAALEDDPRTADATINILNENGVIRLSGMVSKPETSQAAESIAENVEGVASVVNEIQVRKDDDNNDPYDNPYYISGAIRRG